MAELKLGEFGGPPERTIPSQAKEIMLICLDCKKTFQRRGPNHKRCDGCARTKNLAVMKQWHKDNAVTGQGSGALPGEANSNYKHGRNTFRAWARDRLADLNNCCERCGNKIENLRNGWAGHHKDHNPMNNVPDNLEVLCKRCHQIEHECWRAFEGVTTISKESTQETVEAPSPNKGDDIVCSA